MVINSKDFSTRLVSNLTDLLKYFDSGAPTALDTLLQNLSTYELKCLGYCSKLMRSIVLPYIFNANDNLFISSNSVDLEVFQAVVNNDFLRRRVQKVVFDDSTYDERAAQDEYWTINGDRLHPMDIANAAGNATERPDPTSSKPWQNWKVFVRDHLHIRSYGLDLTALNDALVSKLPNVKSIRLTTLNFTPARFSSSLPEFTPGELSPALRRYISLGLPETWPLTPQNRWNSGWLLCRDGATQADLQSRLSRFGTFRSLQAICSSLKQASQLRLEELVISPASVFNDDLHMGLSHHFFDNWNEELAVLKSRMKDLHTFSLSIGGDWHDTLSDTGESPAYENLQRLIRSGRNLKAISLNFDTADPAAIMLGLSGFPGIEVPLDVTILEEHTITHFQNLHSIMFTTATIRQKALLQLVTNHVKTLLILHIEGSELVCGNWSEVLDNLRTRADLEILRRPNRFWLKLYLVSDQTGGTLYEDGSLVQDASAARGGLNQCTLYIRRLRDAYPLVRSIHSPLPVVYEQTVAPGELPHINELEFLGYFVGFRIGTNMKNCVDFTL